MKLFVLLSSRHILDYTHGPFTSALRCQVGGSFVRSKDSSGLRRAKSAYDAEADIATPLEQEVVRRILRAPDVFSVLGILEKGPEALAEVKTAYKKLALRVCLANMNQYELLWVIDLELAKLTKVVRWKSSKNLIWRRLNYDEF